MLSSTGSGTPEENQNPRHDRETDDGAPTPLTAHDPVKIGPYRLVGRLGTGGRGTVYAGLDVKGRRIAVKLVHR